MQWGEKTAAAEPWATQGPGNAQTTQPKSGTLFFLPAFRGGHANDKGNQGVAPFKQL